MELRAPTPSQLYDLTLIGLTWLRHANPGELSRLGSSVIRVMYGAGVIPNAVRVSVGTNYKLIGLAMQNMEKIEGRCPPKRQLDRHIRESDRHLLVLVPRSPFLSVNLFSTKGYKLVITDAGIECAQRKMPSYGQYVDVDRFMESWRRNAKQMRAMYGAAAVAGE